MASGAPNRRPRVFLHVSPQVLPRIRGSANKRGLTRVPPSSATLTLTGPAHYRCSRHSRDNHHELYPLASVEHAALSRQPPREVSRSFSPSTLCWELRLRPASTSSITSGFKVSVCCTFQTLPRPRLVGDGAITWLRRSVVRGSRIPMHPTHHPTASARSKSLFIDPTLAKTRKRRSLLPFSEQPHCYW